MSRQRLTNQTLQDVSRVASATKTVELAERLLGPGATDREVVTAARDLQSLGNSRIRNLQAMAQRINTETSRMAGNGGDDILPEAGPKQLDPTDTQAYVKEIETTPDHSVQDSLTTKNVIKPTASRKPTKKATKASKRRAEMEFAGGDEIDEDLGEDISYGDDSLSDEGMDDPCGMGDEDGGFDLDDNDQDLEAMLEFAGDEDFDDTEEDPMNDEMSDEDFDGESSEDGDFDEDFDDEDLEGVLDDGDDVQEPDIVDEEDLSDEDEDETSDFLDEEETDVAHANRSSSRRGRLAKSKGMSLDDLDDFETQMESSSTNLEGDDLEALMGSKVTRSASRSAGAQGFVPKITANDRGEGFTWDTENDPELSGRRATKKVVQKTRKASQPAQQTQIRKPKARRTASQKAAPRFTPDRRRVAGGRQASAGDEFDNVFGAPDVNSFFND